MNTALKNLRRLSLIFLMAMMALPLLSQSRKDTVPADNSDIIRNYGRSITLSVNEKVRIQTQIKKMVDSCLLMMTLRQESSEQFDPVVIDKFINYFDSTVVRKNENAIPNFYQPRPCLDSTIFPAFYSVNSYVDSAQRWFDYIRIDMASEIVAHDFFYKFRGDLYTYAQVSVEFSAPSRTECDGTVDSAFSINFWFRMSKENVTLASGEKVPVQTKIKFLEVIPLGDEFLGIPPKYQNRWSFLNLTVNGGLSSAAFEALPDYSDLSIEPAANYGVHASYTLFASDTFTVFGKVRRWEYGIELGAGYDHLAWNWKLGSYSHTAVDQTVSPLNDLAFENYDLLTEIAGYKAEESFDILSVPLSIVVKRYLSARKINSVMLHAGVSFNYLLGNSATITSGSISYTGLDCSFQDPQSGEFIEGVTIDNLPYYGFGEYEPVLTDETGDVYEPFFLAAHAKLAFDLRKDRYARLHWIIAPYFNYAVTDFRGDTPMVVKAGGEMSDISAAATSIKPYNFGIEFGIAYNIIPNGLKNVRIKNK